MNLRELPGKPDKHAYFVNKRSDRTYISKAFDGNAIDGPHRKMRIISKVIDSDQFQEFAQINSEVVLRVSNGQRQEIKAYFSEDSRHMDHSVIQRFAKEKGKPLKLSFSFTPDEIQKLLDLFRTVAHLEIDNGGNLRIADDVLDQILLGDDQKKKFLLANPDLVAVVARNNLTKSDIVALGYR